MIALAIDENFDHHLLRALLRRIAALVPGVVEVRARVALGEVLEDLLLLVQCGTPEDFRDLVLYLPLR